MATTNTRARALGQYPTPAWVAEALVRRHFAWLTADDFVIEPACGPGAFLGAVPAHVPALGVEIDADVAAVARAQTGRPVQVGDFRSVALERHPTVIIGNPPFQLDLVDGFLGRAFALLPDRGSVGFLLPAYAFQTASRVADYADRWSLFQEMVPRNVFPGLSIPIVYAIFTKERRRRLVGFALYREAADVSQLADPYRDLVAAQDGGSVWRRVCELALARLGGEAHVQAIYAEVEGHRPTRTQWWRPGIRRTLRRYADAFQALGAGRYALEATCRATLAQHVAGAQMALGLA